MSDHTVPVPTRLRRLGVATALLLAACSGGTAATRDDSPPAGPTCASVIPKMNDAGIAELRNGGADDDLLAEARREAEQLEPRLIQACIDDHWSAELLACMDQAPPLEMSSRCEALVTPEQIEHVQTIREDAAAD